MMTELKTEDITVVLHKSPISIINIGCRTGIPTLKGAQDLGKSKDSRDDQRYGMTPTEVSHMTGIFCKGDVTGGM